MKITAGVLAILLALTLGLTGCGGDQDMDDGEGAMEQSSDAMMNHADDAGHMDGAEHTQDSDAMMGEGEMPEAPSEPAPAEGQ